MPHKLVLLCFFLFTKPNTGSGSWALLVLMFAPHTALGLLVHSEDQRSLHRTEACGETDAMMFASLVSDGTIASLDDPVSKYLDYWTKNTSDPRSQVTVRMLLTFTSGFGGGHPGAANRDAAPAIDCGSAAMCTRPKPCT